MAALEDMLFVGNKLDEDGLTHILIEEANVGIGMVVDLDTGEMSWVGWYVCEQGRSGCRFIPLDRSAIPLTGNPADCMTCLVRWGNRA